MPSLKNSTRKIAVLALIMSLAPFHDADSQDLETTGNEARASAISNQWRAKRGLVTKGSDGKVTFLFGEVQPSIVCSPLQVCDIELEAGEIVRDVLVGDTVRWKVEPASSGARDNQAIHLIVKPSEAGLITSMVVTTSRRTYHMQLRSHEITYMPRVGFDYQTDTSGKLASVNARLDAARSSERHAAEGLDFEYKISGRARWKPMRVYSDGSKTYIQFPRSIAGQDLPALFVVSGGTDRIVNYRFKGDLMTVDFDVQKAVLVSGTGWGKEKITIQRGGR
ncbi:conjugal transfer protein TrbG [Aminobacter sp. DSM 101952]|nr:conjugal transfer protein TrbG [Aminobacter sp. DSM 101952]